MGLFGPSVKVKALPGAVKAAHAHVDAAQWLEAARTVRERAHRLVALWGAERANARRSMYAAYALEEGLFVAELAAPRGAYPDVSGLFPAAGRMQRAARDLWGLEAEGARDTRPWLRHGAWREGEHPARREFDERLPRENLPDRYPFVRVEGDGVHEIPVGPIHAGIIEPGHFRFSIVGEKVLRLEQHLGYTHKGIARRFRDFTLAEGGRLAGRASGDSSVAFAWAYAQAVESIVQAEPPPRALWLRALMLERERIANHLGDLGALGNDAAFGFALAQFMRLKEDFVRLNDRVFGHRFLWDRIVPGGVSANPTDEDLEDLVKQARAIASEASTLRRIFDEHSGLQDRFITAGRVTPQLARQLGMVGLAGRASAQALDLRVDQPWTPYESLAVRKAVHANGDVAARVIVRFEELAESLRLVEAICEALPRGDIGVALPEARAGAFGVGWVEGWRGEVLVAVEADEGGRIAHAHAHDPSWHNWPVLEHAIMGNIVPDFPLINKSFNLSYSGVDG